MPNNRPDQAKFDLFAAHFNQFDSELELFCAEHGYKLDKNLHRQPCRVLRKGDNPMFIIEINLTENWFSTEYYVEMPHAMGVCTYYVAPDDKEHIWKLSEILASNVPFQTIKQNLQLHLSTALKKVSSWTPSVIMEKGSRTENLRVKYEQQGNN